MIDLFYSTSPNVYKVMIALEEMEADYEIHLVDLSKGEQFDPAKLGGSVAAKVPVIRDNAPPDGGEPMTVIESGAILQYLAEKTGLFMPRDLRGRSEVMQWLIWQMAHLGPMGGQYWHFHAIAPKLAPDADISYPRTRYERMLATVWNVMETRLSSEPYLAGDYSIADMACFPWIKYLGPHDRVRYPAIVRWHEAIAGRRAVARAYERNLNHKTQYARNERDGIAYPFEAMKANTIVSGA